MRIALASDHAGYLLKQHLLATVNALGHQAIDLGTDSEAPVDYPDFAEKLGLALRQGTADRGVLLCGSGVGASVAANKMPGIRAAVCHDGYSAHQGVEHDDMNILVLGARIIGSALADDLVKTFLGAKFTHEERHERRLGKVFSIERRWSKEQP
jgi:ribose 5-phosphate isomerase B